MNWFKLCCAGIVTSCILSFSALSAPTLEKNLSNTEFQRLHQCTKYFDYNFYLAGVNIGYSHRIINWGHTDDKVSAEIITTGEVSIFWIGSTYYQKSTPIWSKDNQSFITQDFSQKVTGIISQEMSVKTSESGKKSIVNLDGEISEFTNIKAPLLDLDTLGSQLRVSIAQGQSLITLYGQGANEIKPYLFKVVGKETLELKKWGKVDTIKVIEIGEYDDMVLWFSPKHDWQLIKADIDAFISPSVLLTNFRIECN